MRIGELSARTGASPRSLRYYEQRGLLDPVRTASGQRVYAAAHEVAVRKIQDLFAAGFCSAVIQELLPAMTDPAADRALLDDALAAAERRLLSEKQAIDRELTELGRLRGRLGLAPDTRVSVEDGNHDDDEHTHPTATDHRDRRLR